MLRPLILALTTAAVLVGAERSVAQNNVRRPNGFVNHSQYQPYDITRFSAHPVNPTRYRANPIYGNTPYPSTVFWSNLYPSSPNIQNAQQAANAAYVAQMQNAMQNSSQSGQYATSPGTYSGPAYYPWSDVPLTQGQLGPSR